LRAALVRAYLNKTAHERRGRRERCTRHRRPLRDRAHEQAGQTNAI